MLSIKENIKNEITINKSKFITYLYKVNNEIEARSIIEKLWIEHKFATHICTSYIINNTVRCSDDGEPSGTAGKPILNVLENNNMNYILCCVVRYFGGVKLGAGGLIRAYSKCTSAALNECDLVTLTPGYIVSIVLTYDTIKLVERMNLKIINKDFQERIIYSLEVKVDEYEKLLGLGEVISKESVLISE